MCFAILCFDLVDMLFAWFVGLLRCLCLVIVLLCLVLIAGFIGN